MARIVIGAKPGDGADAYKIADLLESVLPRGVETVVVNPDEELPSLYETDLLVMPAERLIDLDSAIDVITSTDGDIIILTVGSFEMPEDVNEALKRRGADFHSATGHDPSDIAVYIQTSFERIQAKEMEGESG